MAGSPNYKVYAGSEYIAACRYPEDAVLLAHHLGDTTSIRYGHSWTVWRSSVDTVPDPGLWPAAAEIIRQRIQQRIAERNNR